MGAEKKGTATNTGFITNSAGKMDKKNDENFLAGINIHALGKNRVERIQVRSDMISLFTFQFFLFLPLQLFKIAPEKKTVFEGFQYFTE